MTAVESEMVDFIVIGSGPAGFAAATEAAQHGKKVIIIEKEEDVGGVCINTGTFPSKTLREAVLQLTGFYPKQIYRHVWSDPPIVSMDQLRERLNFVRLQEHRIIRNQLAKNHVRLIGGKASFISHNRIRIIDHSGNETTAEGRYIIVATGSVARRPSDIVFDDEYILDSKSLLDLREIPRSLTIVGGGVIGSEYATIFAALGVKVILLDKGDRLLKFLDEEISGHLKKHFPYSKVQYIPGTGFGQITRKNGEVIVTLDNGMTLSSDRLLFALGRQSNTDGLGLDKVGIPLNEYTYIPVNELFQTTSPNIYAVGDVIGWPSLAATSITQGRLAVLHALKKKTSHFPDRFPFGIYTIPEISYIGLTEEQAAEEKMSYIVGRSDYSELPRGQISGDTSGILKLIVHGETREILGAHIIGPAATEIIHIAQMAMQHNGKIEMFTENIFNYPTYSESFKYAALDALNKINLKKSGLKI